DVFSGERNFYVAFDESSRIGKAPEPGILVRNLGKTYEIVETNIKRWSVGLPIQAPLDSLLYLMRTEKFAARDIDTLEIRVATTGVKITDNLALSDICMQHMCAVMLIDGTVTFESSHDKKRMTDPMVLALRRRIDLIGDDELDKL